MTNRQLAVLPIPNDALFIHNSYDVKKNFGEDEREPVAVLREVLYSYLQEKCENDLQKIQYVKTNLDYNGLENYKGNPNVFQIKKEVVPAIKKRERVFGFLRKSICFRLE